MSGAIHQRTPPRCRICNCERARHHYIETAGGRLLDVEPCDCGTCAGFEPCYVRNVFDPRVGHPEGIL